VIQAAHRCSQDDLDPLTRSAIFGRRTDVLHLADLLFAIITFNFPAVSPVTAQTMNYTSAAVGVSVVIAFFTWITTGRRQYTGPQRGHIVHDRH
jgi:choline transport protein